MSFLAQLRAAPNLLTLLRLFIIPFLVIEILDGRWELALSLFMFAGFSDGLDGLAARLLNQKTRLGQYLDPIADKLMLSTLFLVLTHVNLVPRYVTILVFSRDLGILVISIVLFITNTMRDFRPSVWGKLNTLVQIMGVTVIMVEQVWAPAYLPEIRRILVQGIAVLAPLSAAHYAWAISRRINAQEPVTVAAGQRER